VQPSSSRSFPSSHASVPSTTPSPHIGEHPSLQATSSGGAGTSTGRSSPAGASTVSAGRSGATSGAARSRRASSGAVLFATSEKTSAKPSGAGAGPPSAVSSDEREGVWAAVSRAANVAASPAGIAAMSASSPAASAWLGRGLQSWSTHSRPGSQSRALRH
jgi:hypothetical protein